jgi:hypothetical protein
MAVDTREVRRNTINRYKKEKEREKSRKKNKKREGNTLFLFLKVFEFYLLYEKRTIFHIIPCACTGLEPVSPHIKRIIEYDQTGKLFWSICCIP